LDALREEALKLEEEFARRYALPLCI
jgi:hypothetical protein